MWKKPQQIGFEKQIIYIWCTVIVNKQIIYLQRET